MGQEESKQVETEDMNKIRELEAEGGAAALYAYIEQNLHKWKSESVRFAITGRSASGKSTFINAVRGVKPGDKDFAKPGSGDTTQVPMVYPHPQFNNIHFCDLPGIGTINMHAETYAEEMKFGTYDFFFIFFPDVINQNDMLVAKEIIKRQKQFCFVRSKIDNDIASCFYDGVTEEEKMQEIKEKAENLLKMHMDLGSSSKIFYISSRKPQIGEFDLVMKYIREKLPSVKHEAFVNGLACISERIIDEKYKMLKARLYKVTAISASVAAIPIPGVDLAINIAILVNEFIHYIEVFGLTVEQLGDLYTENLIELKCRSFLGPMDKLKSVLVMALRSACTTVGMIATGSAADFVLPFLGSLISAPVTAILVYRFLLSHLNSFKTDTITVFTYIRNKGMATLDNQMAGRK